MSFRLILEATAPADHRYGSDRHAAAEWRHTLSFAAQVYDDEAEALMADYARSGALWGVAARLTLVVEPQNAERVLPRVIAYPGASADKPELIEAFVHVPPSFATALDSAGQVVARLGFRHDWDALGRYDAGDKLGTACAKVEAHDVTVEILGGE